MQYAHRTYITYNPNHGYSPCRLDYTLSYCALSIYCVCIMQGSDVLFGFRKACHVWIAMNQCKDSTSDTSSTNRLEPPHSEAGPSKPSNDNIYDNRNHLYYSEQDMCDRLYSSTSDLSLERRTSSILPLSLSSSAQTLNERIASVPSVSASTGMRKVSFAPTPSVISTEMSEERPQKAPPTKSLCSRLLLNLASLTNYKTRRIQRQSNQMQGYPRLCPRDYPPPPPPCTASHSHLSQESQAHMFHTGSSQGMSDNMLELLFKGTSSTLEQHANDHIPLESANHPIESISRGSSLTNVRGTCSLDVSLFTTLSIDSLNRIERCSSAPSFLIQWCGAMSTAVRTVESESFDHLQLLSAIDSTTSGTVLESGASCDIVSIHNSIEDLFPNASSTTHSTSTSRSDTGLDCTDSCSLHRSIHQLASPSNSTSVSTNSSSETSQLTSASISCLDCDISSEGDLLHLPLSESPLYTSDAMSGSNSTDFSQLTFASASYSTSEVSTESEHTHTSILNDESERMHLSLLQFTSTISSCNELDHLTPYSRSSIDADTSTESNAIHLPLSDSLLDTSDATEIETDQLVSDSSTSMDSGESIPIYPSLPDNTDANAITAIPSSSVTDVEHTLADENGSTECAAMFSNNRAVELVQGKNEVVPVCEVADVCLSLDQPSTSDHGRSLSAKSASNESNNIESSFISLRDVSCVHNVDASLIDVPSLISTLKHVASLLSSSHAMLDLSLSTLQEKLCSQPSIPSNYCVCVRNGRCHRDVDLNRSNSKIVAASKSEPLLHPV